MTERSKKLQPTSPTNPQVMPEDEPNKVTRS